MRTLVCIFLTAAAWQIHGQGTILGATGSYAGEIPHRTTAPVLFQASLGEFTNGPLRMELVAKDAETDETILALRGDAVEHRRRIVKVGFPFGGRYAGRYRRDLNVFVGRFYHFAPRGEPRIPRRLFVMTNTVTAASPPVN